jgi:hypothetical protein
VLVPADEPRGLWSSERQGVRRRSRMGDDPEWPVLFEELRVKLSELLGGEALIMDSKTPLAL